MSIANREKISSRRTRFSSQCSQGVITDLIKYNNSKSSSLICGGNPEPIFYIPQHDGWIGLEKDEAHIAEMVLEMVFRLTGYKLTITKTALATGQETVLKVGPSP